ncbi:DUF2536 family protein [Alteribacillus sp. HJP-4]|uniref:DUF2536 family protein n=1 Tax=Alteribacillus sp. HJP-4 TaxID=2775394 RepID=UPI0035CCF39D
MNIKLNPLSDKIEFFEANSLTKLEQSIQHKIEQNEAIMLDVYHAEHNVYTDPKSMRPIFTAMVHFKSKK